MAWGHELTFERYELLQLFHSTLDLVWASRSVTPLGPVLGLQKHMHLSSYLIYWMLRLCRGPSNYCSNEFALLSFREHSLSGPKASRPRTVKGRTWWTCWGKPSREEMYDIVLGHMSDLVPSPRPLLCYPPPSPMTLASAHLGLTCPSWACLGCAPSYSGAVSFAGVWPGHSCSCEWHSGDHDDLWLWRP